METVRRKKRSQWQDVWRRFKKNKLAVFGLIMLIALLVVAILAFFFVDYENVITQNVRNKFGPWTAENPLGTDSFGRDILSRLLYASRFSLAIGFAVVVLSITSGTIIGAVAIAIIAVLPMLMAQGNMSVSFGGTSILILVGVAIETYRQLESQMLMRNYKGFLD